MNVMLTRTQPTPTKPSAASVTELRLFRTHTAAVGHARSYRSAPYQPMSIVDTQNDDAMECGSIIEEIRPRKSRQCRHRVFSADVKSAAIARVLEDGRDIREVAAALDLSQASLQRWVVQAQAMQSHAADATEPSAWLELPLPIDCNGAEPAEPTEPAEPPAPPEEAPPPSEEAPPPQEFPPNSEPDIEPPAPPEQAPPPQEVPPASYA